MELDRDQLFKRLRSRPENKMCFDCPARNPTWATVPYAAFLCLQCAGVHRSLGVHISFVRSTTLDSWSSEQLKLFAIGGNARARQFFKQHGWDEVGSDKIEAKYTSRAAQLYRAMLDKEAAKLTPAAAVAIASGHGKEHGLAPGDLHDFHHLQEAAVAPGTAPGPVPPQQDPAPSAAPTEADSKPAAPVTATVVAVTRPASALASKPRLGVTKKAAGGKLGLGVQKLGTKVDEALFDQAPAAPQPAPQPTPTDPLLGAVAGGLGDAVKPGSRFSYELVTGEAPTTMQRGKDGHLTLGAKSDDFFGGKSDSRTGFAGKPEGARASSAAAPAAASGSSVAQQKFGAAKAISSRDFQDSIQESEVDRQARLTRFQGAASISSADYFNNGSGPGSGPGAGGSGPGLGTRRSGSTRSGDLDMGAAAGALVSQLSVKASQDLRQMAGSVSQAAGSMSQKLSGMANRLMSDLGRGY